MKKKVIIAIDPGSPKNRDKSATTGVFVGEYYEPKKLETLSFEIYTESREQDENLTARSIKALKDKYVEQGFEVDVVLEQYINYAYNGAANNFQKNHTSELIGKIRFALDGQLVEQATSQIKTKYSDRALESMGILIKNGNRWNFSEEFGGGESNRHERDSCRHYLLRRDKLGLFNDLGDVWEW